VVLVEELIRLVEMVVMVAVEMVLKHLDHKQEVPELGVMVLVVEQKDIISKVLLVQLLILDLLG
jgi:hypothetical protein